MRALPAALLVLLLAGTACSDDGRPSMDDTSKARTELLQRPPLESEVARLEALRTAVRDALSAELGLTRWSDRDDATGAACDDFDDVDARTAFLDSLLLTGGVPDAQWPKAVDVLAKVAGGSGFGAPETVVDNPGEHEVVLRGERGSLIRFGTGSKNATLAVEAGCHLPEAIHKAG